MGKPLRLRHIIERTVQHALAVTPGVTDVGTRTSRARVSGTYRVSGSLPVPGVQTFLTREATERELEEVRLRELGDALVKLACPRELVLRVQAAAADKERQVARLLRFAGVDTLAFAPVPPNSGSGADLFDFAFENAIERCVGGTFSAAQLSYQAERADVALRGLFGELSDDESEHARLAFELHDWATSQLSPARIRTIRKAQRDRYTDLRGQIAFLRETECEDVLGLPARDTAHAILDALELQILGAGDAA